MKRGQQRNEVISDHIGLHLLHKKHKQKEATVVWSSAAASAQVKCPSHLQSLYLVKHRAIINRIYKDEIKMA